MNIGTIPARKMIFLKKKSADVLCIKPGKTLVNDNLYIAYDVKINGIIAIPKGTRVQGDWVTEHTPNIAAQFQLTRIFLDRNGTEISGDSDIIDSISEYNAGDVRDADFFYKKQSITTVAGISRRVVELGYNVITLDDSQLDTIYIEIKTEEITVTLSSDFVIYS